MLGHGVLLRSALGAPVGIDLDSANYALLELVGALLTTRSKNITALRLNLRWSSGFAKSPSFTDCWSASWELGLAEDIITYTGTEIRRKKSNWE